MVGFLSFALRRLRFALATAIGVTFFVVGVYADATGVAVLGFQSWAWQAVGATVFFVAVLALLYQWDADHHARNGSAPAPAQKKLRWPWPQKRGPTNAELKALPDKVFAPTIIRGEPLRLSKEEAERRIRAVDEMYEVLNTQGADVCTSGQKLATPIRDLPFANGATDTWHSLKVWRSNVADLTKAIRSVHHRNALLESVYPKALLEFDFDERLQKALDEISGAIGIIERIEKTTTPELAHKIMRDLMLLCESKVLPFQKAVNVLEAWVSSRKDELKAVRKSLLDAAP